MEAFQQSKDCSIHKTFPAYNELKAAYRFLANEKVTESLLIQSMSRSCSLQSRGKRVLAICDSSTINTTAKLGRITDFDGLGIVARNQNKESIGFFIHPVYIIDETNDTPYGVANVKVYNRSMERSTIDKSKRDILRSIPIEEKESYKWIEPCVETRDRVLHQAEHVTYIMDREGDIIEVFEHIPDARSDVVVRNMHNRKIINEQGQKLRLYDQIGNQEVDGHYRIKLQEKIKKKKKKEAVIAIKWGNCELLSPRGHKLTEPIKVSYVEVREVGISNKEDGDPIHWIILTSIEITSKAEAKKIVEVYQKRWGIEVFFKLIKTDGYNIEKTELETGQAIRKLTLLLMQASIRLLQLKAAREGATQLKVDEVFTEQEVECLELLNEQLQGETEKQKNPYENTHLSWASWIIARLGGWKEYYTKNRPPGNKTFKTGLQKFDSIMIGFNIAGDG